MSPDSPSNGPPLFIVLEGIDGSGTTTQLERLAARLRARGRRVVATREPTPGPIGLLLREILMGRHANPDGTSMDGRAMALLFAADRRDHPGQAERRQGHLHQAGGLELDDGTCGEDRNRRSCRGDAHVTRSGTSPRRSELETIRWTEPRSSS